MSLIDGSKLHLTTKANGKIDATFNPLGKDGPIATLKIDSKKYDLLHDGLVKLTLSDMMFVLKSHTTLKDEKFNLDAALSRSNSVINIERSNPKRKVTIDYKRVRDTINFNINGPIIEASVSGDGRSGKIHLRNKETNYDLESKYTVEGRKLIIEPTSSENAKLQASLSLREPSNFLFESPKVNIHMNMDLNSPVKVLHFDFDNPSYEKKIDAKYEQGQEYKYSSYGKVKESNEEHKIDLAGKFCKQINFDVSLPGLKFKLDRPEDGDKLKMSYTFNEYTENEEFDFKPNQSCAANWARIVNELGEMFVH